MFNFYDNRNILYVILAILVISSLATMTQDYLLGVLLTLPGVIIAITFHEFAHAYAAYRLGDDTPRMQGRLNLNPLSHIDPTGIILLIFAHIGWGKPVQINPNNFDRKYSASAGEAIVSIAGPVMNFLIAIVFTIIYFILMKFATAFLFTTAGSVILTIVISTIVVNIGLGVFNLIPLPPLDGSKIFRNFMSYNVKMWLDKYQQVFYIIFLVLWITGLLGVIVSPVINVIQAGLFKVIGLLFGM